MTFWEYIHCFLCIGTVAYALIVALCCVFVNVVAAGENGVSQSRQPLRQARGRAGKPILPSARPAPPVTLRIPPYAKL